MVGGAARLDRAAATHRQAAALATAVGTVLERPAPGGYSAPTERAVREFAERLRVAAALLAPGWLGAPLDAVPASTPLGMAPRPERVRIGTAYPLDDASFPVVVPLGHLALDGDARDGRVAGLLRATLLRLLASVRPGTLLVRVVDPAGAVLPAPESGPGARRPAPNPFTPLHDAGIMPPPVTDRGGLQAVLTEAERWVRGDHAGRDRTLLLVLAGWPQATEADDLARVAALAATAPTGGLHLLVAGWPPPPLGGAPAPPLPHATQLTLRNPYALVGHPPGGSFGAPTPPGRAPSPGLNAPVYLDEAPPADLAARVCDHLAGHVVDRARVALGELLPDGPLWTDDAATGLRVVIGRARGTPVTLRLGDATPHWLVLGGPGAGKTALLLDILYGLCTRYGPDQLSAYLLDFTGAAAFADFVPQPNDPSYLPHARAVGLEPGREDGLAVLRALAARLARREPDGPVLPRIVCVVDGVGALLAGADPLADEAAGLLTELARRGGAQGLHLVLASRVMPPAAVAAQCRVRIALPGGSAVLDPANHAAAGLTLGTAVVNTAAGLGGPRGATRAHEQLVRFPDPRADEVALAGLRHRLWRAARRRP
jgi:hypothetical protein